MIFYYKKKPVIFCFTGPTASGKSQISFEFAQKIKADIISCDSVAIYKECVIGSAQPSDEWQQKVPHHLIGTYSLKEIRFDVHQFIQKTKDIIKQLLNQKKNIIICGGSYFYLYHLYEGLSSIPPRKEKVTHLLNRFSTNYLYETLLEIDSLYAKKIQGKDRQRILRAVEVYLSYGQSVSNFAEKIGGLSSDFHFEFICLHWPKEQLISRMKNRLKIMLKSGWIEEVEGLIKDPLIKKKIRNFIGYREIIEFLEGNLSETERDDKILTQNWRLAKHQYTWIKRNHRVKWFECDGELDLEILHKKLNKVCQIYE